MYNKFFNKLQTPNLDSKRNIFSKNVWFSALIYKNTVLINKTSRQLLRAILCETFFDLFYVGPRQRVYEQLKFFSKCCYVFRVPSKTIYDF